MDKEFSQKTSNFTRHAEYWRVFLSATNVPAAMQPTVVKFCMMVELCTGRVFSPFGSGTSNRPPPKKKGNFGPIGNPFDREYLKNGKSHITYKLGFNVRSKGAF